MLDVLVLGGGAAGLFAATAAAELGASTLLLEKNRRPGVKILASGGSRCNVTTVLPVHELLPHFGRAAARFLGPALRALDPRAVVELLHAEGVPTYRERFDKVFPASNRATDVLAAFLRRLERSGARLQCDAAAVQGSAVSRRADGTFAVATGAAEIEARRVIVAVGGQSYPKTGSTGDGYALAAALGHAIVAPRPALVPLRVAEPWVRELAGIAEQDVAVRLLDGGGRTLAERRRPLLFTHFGLSGPAAMDVSREVRPEHGAIALVADFLPEVPAAELAASIARAIAAHPARALARAIEVPLPERLVEALLRAHGIDPLRRAAESQKRHREAAAAALKAARIPIAGTQGFDRAEVTAGGVALDEVDPATMESRRCPGLYFCGEILDVDGPIGGFNFQAAFSTGALAGRAAARARLEEGRGGR